MAKKRVLPGFHASLAVTLGYLGIMLLVPLAACFVKAATIGPDTFLAAAWSPRSRAAYALTFGASFVAATGCAILGLLVAWVLTRYTFPGKRLIDALVDLPLALPTAVAGLVYSCLYVENGWLGQVLVPLGVEGAYSRLGIVMVLIFVGLPFVTRAVQPVLESLDEDMEEAAHLLGASRWQIFRRVLLPALAPSLLAGFALSFARALGEYGSVVFISGNKPFRTEIAPVLIVARLEEFAYAEATAIAAVLLVFSFAMLILINLLERRSLRYAG